MESGYRPAIYKLLFSLSSQLAGPDWWGLALAGSLWVTLLAWSVFPEAW